MIPTARRDLAGALAGEAARIRQIVVPQHLADAPVFQAQFADNVADLERMRSTVVAADLFWVAAPMVRAALDASQDVPGLRVEDAPATVGLLVVAEPLPAWDTSEVGGLALRDGAGAFVEHMDGVEVDAIAWHSHDGVVDLDLMVRPHRLPLPLHGVEPAHLAPFAHFRFPLPTRLGAGMPALGAQGVALDGAWQGPAAFLAAAWVMMRTPTVAQRTTLDTATGSRSVRDVTATGPSPKEVVIVDVRPMRQVTDPDGPGSGRRLTTRHLVRGHWTHQPYGPKRALRRLQWVPSYVRGPEGAPWSGGETVYAWRR